MIAHQIVWCGPCLKVEAIHCITGISILATLLCIAAGVYELVFLDKAVWCGLFYFSDVSFYDSIFETMDWYKDGYYSGDDECPERVYAALSFVTASFWAASSVCSLIFVQSGQYSEWEAKWNQKFEGNNEEVPTSDAPDGTVSQLLALHSF